MSSGHSQELVQHSVTRGKRQAPVSHHAIHGDGETVLQLLDLKPAHVTSRAGWAALEKCLSLVCWLGTWDA